MFKVFFIIVPNSTFFLFLFFFFWLHQLAGWNLVPKPGIKPESLAVEVKNPNHWTTREFPTLRSFKSFKAVLKQYGKKYLER